MILHCMKKTTWEERRNKSCWGQRNIAADGFIHCSTIEYFWRVAPNFEEIKEELVLICIDENLLDSKVRFEDGDHCGRAYPHIYGMVNNTAVVKVLPYLRDEDGKYVKNQEFKDIEDK